MMDQFESQVENLAVQTGSMEQAMAGTAQASTPEDQVSNLIQQVADEQGLEFNARLADASATGGRVKSAAKEADEEQREEEDELAQRLAKLRNS